MKFVKNKNFSDLSYDHVYFARMSDGDMWGFDMPSTTFVALSSISNKSLKPVCYKETLKRLVKRDVRENEN